MIKKRQNKNRNTYCANIIKDIAVQFWISVAILLGFILYFVSRDWTVFILTFTATLLVWYSYETRGVRRASIDANRLASMPALTIRYKRDGINEDGNWMLLLSNVGKGVALHPRIIPVEHNAGETITFDLRGVNAIYQGHSVRVLWIADGKTATNPFMDLANNPIVIKVEFSSALDTSGYFYTEHLVKNPPYAEIINTRWI